MVVVPFSSRSSSAGVTVFCIIASPKVGRRRGDPSPLYKRSSRYYVGFTERGPAFQRNAGPDSRQRRATRKAIADPSRRDDGRRFCGFGPWRLRSESISGESRSHAAARRRSSSAQDSPVSARPWRQFKRVAMSPSYRRCIPCGPIPGRPREESTRRWERKTPSIRTSTTRSKAPTIWETKTRSSSSVEKRGRPSSRWNILAPSSVAPRTARWRGAPLGVRVPAHDLRRGSNGARITAGALGASRNRRISPLRGVGPDESRGP